MNTTERRPREGAGAPGTTARKSTSSIAPTGDICSQARPNLDPERAYCGALLWLPVDRAAHAADLVQPGDLADPKLRVVLGLVRDVVADCASPDPVTVLAHAQRSGTVTAHGIKTLAELLAAVYAECPLAGSVGWYAGAVLDGALRRRCAVLGERIGQVAESASLAELVRVVGAEVVAVYELRNRRATVLAGLGMPVQEVAA